jgi:hypothetical protein
MTRTNLDACSRQHASAHKAVSLGGWAFHGFSESPTRTFVRPLSGPVRPGRTWTHVYRTCPVSGRPGSRRMQCTFKERYRAVVDGVGAVSGASGRSLTPRKQNNYLPAPSFRSQAMRQTSNAPEQSSSGRAAHGRAVIGRRRDSRTNRDDGRHQPMVSAQLRISFTGDTGDFSSRISP